MIDVELGNDTYTLPTGWNEVSLEMFQKIMELNNMYKDYKSDVLFSLDVFAILMDTTSDKLKLIDQTSFKILTEELSWVQTEVTKDIDKEIIINGQKYIYPKDLNSLSMGEVISIETIIKEVPESEVLVNILSIILRPVKIVKTKDGESKEVIVPFDNDYVDNLLEIKNLFRKNIMVSEVFHIQSFFLTGGK